MVELGLLSFHQPSLSKSYDIKMKWVEITPGVRSGSKGSSSYSVFQSKTENPKSQFPENYGGGGEKVGLAE